MGLVTAKEVAKAINTDKYGFLGTFSGWVLMKVLKISELNNVYDRKEFRLGICRKPRSCYELNCFFYAVLSRAYFVQVQVSSVSRVLFYTMSQSLQGFMRN